MGQVSNQDVVCLGHVDGETLPSQTICVEKIRIYLVYSLKLAQNILRHCYRYVTLL